MIKSCIKVTVLFALFMAVMSITVGKRPLFAHIYDFISPATKSVQNSTEDFFAKSMSSTQSYSKKLFDNSVPKVKDAVDSKLSSRKKFSNEEPAEEITQREKSQLDDLIKNH